MDDERGCGCPTRAAAVSDLLTNPTKLPCPAVLPIIENKAFTVPSISYGVPIWTGYVALLYGLFLQCHRIYNSRFVLRLPERWASLPPYPSPLRTVTSVTTRVFIDDNDDFETVTKIRISG